MSITKNWELHGTDGHWLASAKPTELGGSKIELSIAHNGPKPGPATRDMTIAERNMVGIKKLVAEVGTAEEIRELSFLLIKLADAIDGELA